MSLISTDIIAFTVAGNWVSVATITLYKKCSNARSSGRNFLCRNKPSAKNRDTGFATTGIKKSTGVGVILLRMMPFGDVFVTHAAFRVK
jgi:hypothetical protein